MSESAAALPEAPSPFQRFDIHPQMVERGKKGARLASTDLISVGVQVIGSGGETNLHAHANQDAVWLVLAGKARFYGEGDREIATLGKLDGLVIPRGTLYWFESASEEPLVITRTAARDPNIEPGRVNRGERVSRDNLKLKEGEYFQG